jgi:hypothetical protein
MFVIVLALGLRTQVETGLSVSLAVCGRDKRIVFDIIYIMREINNETGRFRLALKQAVDATKFSQKLLRFRWFGVRYWSRIFLDCILWYRILFGKLDRPLAKLGGHGGFFMPL